MQMAMAASIYKEFEKNFDETIARLKSPTQPKKVWELADKLASWGYWMFDSDPRYCLREGDIYYLGTNPHPDPERKSVRDRFEDWEGGYVPPHNWQPYSGLLDNPAKGKPWKGWAAVRDVITEVLHGLGIHGEERVKDAIRAIPCSNLCFFMSNHPTELISEDSHFFTTSFDCWRYHERMLRLVHPRVIVCNGNATQ